MLAAKLKNSVVFLEQLSELHCDPSSATSILEAILRATPGAGGKPHTWGTMSAQNSQTSFQALGGRCASISLALCLPIYIPSLSAIPPATPIIFTSRTRLLKNRKPESVLKGANAAHPETKQVSVVITAVTACAPKVVYPQPPIPCSFTLLRF